MNEDKKWQLTLLQILRVCGNVYYLVDDRHSYTDVLLFINKLRAQGLVCKENDSFKLTKEGFSYYHQLCHALGKKGVYKYFMESSENKTVAINIEDIYIPRKRLRL